MQGMYEGALEGRVALRIPAMRKQPFILHGETAHLVFHACRPPDRARRNGSSQAAMRRLRADLLRAARDPRTVDELRDAVPKAPERLAPVLNAMTNEGLMLRMRADSVLDNSFRYVSTRGWLGHSMPPAATGDALVWLAGEYVTTYGPATVADFAIWAGIDEERAADVLSAHDLVDIGDGMMMWRKDARSFDLARPVAGRINLLPALDPYTMGYTGSSRLRFADERVLRVMFDAAGNSGNVVLIEGAVGGLWDLKSGKNDEYEMRIGLFDDPGPKAWLAIQGEAQLLAGFLNAREFKVTRAKARLPKAK